MSTHHPTHWILAPLILLGLFPTLLFFIWIERNMGLPYLGPELHMPWNVFDTPSTFSACLWNAAIVLVWGAIHSTLAQPQSYRFLSKWMPLATLRAFYVIIAGSTALGTMGLWQNTGQLIWHLPLMPPVARILLSNAIFWTFLGVGAWSLIAQDALEFIGIRQSFEIQKKIDPASGEIGLHQKKLQTTGLYQYCRHPLYLGMILAIFVTPTLSLDRLTLGLTWIAYLTFAIPLEEKKLKSKYGSAYREYQTIVPCILPRPRRPISNVRQP